MIQDEQDKVQNKQDMLQDELAKQDEQERLHGEQDWL